MCGIAAICETGPPRPRAIRAAVDSLVHRGPDSGAVEAASGCQLGHRRLAVIDLNGGAQPMWDDQHRYCVTFNGEIYNFRELRSELRHRGVSTRTESDTEVLLLAYREYGEAILDKLNGQFAFAVWDNVQKTLFAARDRLGEKPLYYAESAAGELVLASEVKAIVASGLLSPVLDRRSVSDYLSLLYVPPDRSIYENIKPLPPGHAMRWQAGRRISWRYWHPEISGLQISRREAVLETRRLVEQAVKRQTVADVPVGAFLSGGLDSATIVALMSRQTDSAVMTFSAGFGDLINELPYAREVAACQRTRHHEVNIEIPVGEMLEEMAEVFDEPFADSSNIPTYLLSRFASERVKVVLSGDGGDELFGGYDWYLPLLAQESLSAHPLSAALNRAIAKLPLFSLRKAASRRYKQIRAKRQYPDTWERHLAFVSVTTPAQQAELWGNDFLPATRHSLEGYFQPPHDLTGLDRATDFDVRCYLPGDILVKVDRAAMAHGLETRSPFLDKELVEFVLALPAELRFSGTGLKGLLREACGDLWPASIRNRRKQGFGAPISSWLQRSDVQSLLDRVLSNHSPLGELVSGASKYRGLERKQPHAVWSLLCLGLWLEKRADVVAPVSRAA